MLEAEKDNTDSETSRQARREACAKHLQNAQLKLKKTELLLEQATEKVAEITLLLKTLLVWATTLLPTDSETIHLQTQILERKATKKHTTLEAQILAYQISLAGLRAEIAEAEKILEN